MLDPRATKCVLVHFMLWGQNPFLSKFYPDGTVERLKAHLVDKSYTYTYGINYDETFSPVAKVSFVCVFISLAANLDWPLFHLDVKNVFLH
jgi:hypothetical protein